MKLLGGFPQSREVLTRALTADRTRLPVQGWGDRKEITGAVGSRDKCAKVGVRASMESRAEFAVLGSVVRKGPESQGHVTAWKSIQGQGNSQCEGSQCNQHDGA